MRQLLVGRLTIGMAELKYVLVPAYYLSFALTIH